jgi:putative DNA primase/helicase
MEESSSDSWELVLPWLLQLRRLKIAVIIVAHAGRNGFMRGTSRREDSAFWILKLTPTGDDKTGGERQATFISHFDKERNSGKAQQPIEWTFETDASGIVKVTHKIADTLTVFRQWVEVGLNSATEIAEAMELSKGQVSKLAKRAMEAGWLVNENRRYKLVSRTPA